MGILLVAVVLWVVYAIIYDLCQWLGKVLLTPKPGCYVPIPVRSFWGVNPINNDSDGGL